MIFLYFLLQMKPRRRERRRRRTGIMIEQHKTKFSHFWKSATFPLILSLLPSFLSFLSSLFCLIFFFPFSCLHYSIPSTSSSSLFRFSLSSSLLYPSLHSFLLRSSFSLLFLLTFVFLFYLPFSLLHSFPLSFSFFFLSIFSLLLPLFLLVLAVYLFSPLLAFSLVIVVVCRNGEGKGNG